MEKYENIFPLRCIFLSNAFMAQQDPAKLKASTVKRKLLKTKEKKSWLVNN